MVQLRKRLHLQRTRRTMAYLQRWGARSLLLKTITYFLKTKRHTDWKPLQIHFPVHAAARWNQHSTLSFTIKSNHYLLWRTPFFFIQPLFHKQSDMTACKCANVQKQNRSFFEYVNSPFLLFTGTFPFHKVLEQRLEVSSWCLTDSCLVIRQAFLKWVNINSCGELPGRQVDGQDVHSLKGVTMQSVLQGSKQGWKNSGREESEHLNTDKCCF